MKKSFMLYVDSLDVLDKLDNDTIAELFIAFRDYNKGNEVKLSKIADIVFSQFKNQFDRDEEKYEGTCKARAEAGSKGGKQKVANVANASKAKQKVANVADKEKDTDKDTKEKTYKKENSHQEEKEPPDIPTDCQEFLNEYPKQASRLKAMQAYHEAIHSKTVTHAEILAGIKRYKHHISAEKVSAQYVKNPAKWLDEGCWADIYEEDKPYASVGLGEWKESEIQETPEEFAARVSQQHAKGRMQ